MEHILGLIIFATSTVASVLYMLYMRKKPVDEALDKAPFTLRQKPFVLALVILSPIIAGAIFYYGWIKRFPKKAKRANWWSIVVFAIWVALFAIFG